MAALSVMTCISVAIGLAFKSMPEALQSTIPVGQYLGAATMLYFGIKTLRVRKLAQLERSALASHTDVHRAPGRRQTMPLETS